MMIGGNQPFTRRHEFGHYEKQSSFWFQAKACLTQVSACVHECVSECVSEVRE